MGPDDAGVAQPGDSSLSFASGGLLLSHQPERVSVRFRENRELALNG